AVTEGTTDCVLVKDLQGRYLMINSAGALRRGKTAAEVLGKVDSDLFSAETARILSEADRRVLAADVTQTFEETTVEDSVTRTHLVTKGPHRNPRGEVIGIIGMARDITERKQVETELQRAKEEADSANLAKSEFLSRMSHELRTPLNAILGFGQILDSEDLDAASKESVGYILKGGRHLLDLINEVLDIARVEAGRLDMSLEPIALDDIVPEVCALVRPLAAERNIHLSESTSALSPLYVLADSQRFKQVLINLLSNAIKYNREGSKVEVSCSQKPDGCISIAVYDNGPGISSQDLSKLFVPFERLNAFRSDIEGTGLGLALSQRLVTAMGGKLTVESILGQGTAFTMELPQAISTEKQLLNVPEGMKHLETNEEEEQTYSVLCIEDNPSNLRLIEAIFRGRPEIKLLTALQGSIGLDMARQHAPDLILLDLNLPDIHGKEVLSRLQESARTKEIPVVVVSADATPKQVERLLAAGAKAYLTKPLNISQFLKTLDDLLHPTSVT
ncbi:MAG TPA: ATP-binding protein, partial [Abditibacteriaceae bacterium]